MKRRTADLFDNPCEGTIAPHDPWDVSDDPDFVEAAFGNAMETIKQLEAEVRTAYARGFEAAKKAAVEAVEKDAKRRYVHGVAVQPTYYCSYAADAIRAVKMGEEKP